MPGKKIYAVRKGRQTGLFETWEECKRMVHGFPGAVYKSFTARQEALEYLDGAARAPHQIEHTPEDPAGEDLLVVYVDGSYD